MTKPSLLLCVCLLCACDSKRESLIDSQKAINKQLVGLSDSLNRVSDTAALSRIRSEIHYQQFRFDSIGKLLNNK